MVFSMGLMCGVLDFSMWKSVDRGQQYCFGGKFIDSLLLKYWFLFLFLFFMWVCARWWVQMVLLTFVCVVLCGVVAMAI